MAVAFSDPTSAVVTTASVTVSTPAAPTGTGPLNANHIIFAVVFMADAGVRWTGYAAEGWNEARFQDVTAGRNMHILWRRATESEPSTRTLGPYTGSTITYGVAFSCSGLDIFNPVLLTDGTDNSATGTTVVEPALSPSITNAMLFWTAGISGNAVTTNTSTSSNKGDGTPASRLYDVNGGTTDSGRGIFGGYFEQLSASGSTGTRTITSTQSGGNRVGIIMALNPAPPIQSVGILAA